MGDRIWRRHVDQMLSAGATTDENTADTDDLSYPLVENEQPDRNERQHPTVEERNPQAETSGESVTEPPENNFHSAADTARYPKRSHYPPDYFHSNC